LGAVSSLRSCGRHHSLSVSLRVTLLVDSCVGAAQIALSVVGTGREITEVAWLLQRIGSLLRPRRKGLRLRLRLWLWLSGLSQVILFLLLEERHGCYRGNVNESVLRNMFEKQSECARSVFTVELAAAYDEIRRTLPYLRSGKQAVLTNITPKRNMAMNRGILGWENVIVGPPENLGELLRRRSSDCEHQGSDTGKGSEEL